MSNRLTFSLASLVLILALGLVFAPVSVMAHAPVSDGADDPMDVNLHPAGLTTLATHMHPSVSIAAKAEDSDPTKAGDQVIGGITAGSRDVTFDVVITVDELVQSEAGNALPDSAFNITTGDTAGLRVIIYNDKNASAGTVSITTAFAQADAAMKPREWTGTLTIMVPSVATGDGAEDMDVAAAIKAGLHVEVKMVANTIESSTIVGTKADQSNLETAATFTIISEAVTEKVAFKVTGTPSVTDDFTVTFTADKEDAVLAQGDIKVDGGTVIRFGKDPFPPAGKTVYNAEIRPALHARMISVTIDSAAAAAKPAAGDDGKVEESIGEATITDISPNPAIANDEADFEVIFTFNRALPNPLMLEHLSIGTTAGDAGDMMDGDKANDTVTGAKDPMFLGTPNRVPGETMKWRVTVSPKADANTIVGLSEAGMERFTYGSGVKALTVTKGIGTGTPDVTAEYKAGTGTTTGTTTISEGVIGANDFVVIGHDDLPDLELFFDIGGTIGLDDGDDADDKNSRAVVMSEILWGLDFGEQVLADQSKHQFIELYNTTAEPINLKDWELVFTRGNVVPASDIDQVSNRGVSGWEVDTGDTGKSGRVAETFADDPESTITPVNIVSMYRKIDYTKVEKVKADGTADPSREEQLKGIPGGNVIGSWANSQIRGGESRWIYATPGEKHHTRVAILTASSVAGTPFRINEFGNDTGGDNDWVELHNVSDAEASLNHYQLTMVTDNATDTELFDFHENDWKIPAGGFVVISTRHPRDTDLATGRDISVPDDEELNKGLIHLYVVKSGWDLQDDGKFALILRGGHGDAHKSEKTANHLIDVVATREGAFSATNTRLWPLKIGGFPHENVIDGTDQENFAAGKVYQRNGGNGRGDKSLAVAAYTGIGYDVKASKISSNHGTPGYDNGAAKVDLAGIGDDTVTISEVMTDVGDSPRRTLPQWIELHNASDTLGVNLAGWKLNIENAAQEDGELETNTFSATITLGNKYILPNQTILIASRSGDVRDPNHFPPTRVVDLWTTKAHRDALEMTKSTDPVLSTRGFYIQLVDKDGAEIDEVGNLDGNRRTRDEPAWALPMSEDPNSRSSLLRVYDSKVALDGTAETSWILASDTVLAFERTQAYYGDADDVGTPGYRTGGPLPVSLSKFRPERLKETGEIVVRWITESELNNAGFNVLRSETRNGEFTKMNTSLIKGQGTTSERTTYEWKDSTAKPNVVYYYQIQDVSLDGKVTTLRQSRLKGHISAAGKLTTTWGELKALQ